MRAYRSAGLVRSLTLLRTFLLASAGILAVGALTLSGSLERSLRAQALEDAARGVGVLVDAAVAPAIVEGGRLMLTPRAAARLRRTAVRTRDLRSLAVWSPRGQLLFATGARRPRTGARPPELRETLARGEPHAVASEPRSGAPTVVDVWTPVRSAAGRPLGAAQVTLDGRVLGSAVAGPQRTIWLTIVLVFGALWLLLALLVRGASLRLRRQNAELAARSGDLLATARELEQTLLETIETLNAAVEARDPYTAGHSQRVRRVALAVARELGLPAKTIGAIGTAALFHDIGKIGMPDSILTKPGPLSPAEAAIMREHVVRGAEIVARISSLQHAVPAIRHHHERWDGLGYPDGLSGEEIPIEAAVIALADAWDAMTTDRPYAAALELNEAMLQIRAGREKQFNPAVVDAFWAVARRRPAEILPPAAPAAVVVAV